MGINGVMSGTSQGSGYNVNATNMDDAKLKEYDQNLNRLQQKLQRTEKDIDLSEQEKRKKEQELQREIEELNRQKLLAEQEKRQKEMPGTGKIAAKKLNGIDQSSDPEKKQKEDSSRISTKPVDVQKEQDKKEEEQNRQPLLTANQMESVIIGGSTLAQSKPHKATVKELENRIRVLSGEINTDKIRENDTTKKEKEVKDLEERAARARENTVKHFGDGKRKVEERQQEAQKEIKQQQQNENIRFIRSQKDVALPNFQITI